MTRQAQVIWNQLGSHVTKYNPALLEYLRSLHLAPTDPHAMALVAAELGRQAQMGAMLAVFQVTTWSFLGMLPLVLLLRRSR
jgi:hypothetical protein